MQVLSVTSEVYPLIKTGGLADVAGALPLALAGQDIAMRTLAPGYPVVMRALKGGKAVHRYANLQGGPATVVAAVVGGLDMLVLDAPHLFDRPGGPYADPATGSDWPDNWRRFAALSRAGADIGAGLVSAFKPDPRPRARLAGSADARLSPLRSDAAPAFGDHRAQPCLSGPVRRQHLPRPRPAAEALALDGVEYYGGVGFLKAGLQAATAITTVSPTYAQEIRTAGIRHGA